MHSTFNVNKQRIREQQQQYANGELERQARKVNFYENLKTDKNLLEHIQRRGII